MKNLNQKNPPRPDQKPQRERREPGHRSEFNNVRRQDELADPTEEAYDESERMQREIRHSNHRF